MTCLFEQPWQWWAFGLMVVGIWTVMLFGVGFVLGTDRWCNRRRG